MFPPYPQYIFLAFARQHIPSAGAGLIADAPCGSGYIAYSLSKERPSKQVLGVDIDESYIEFARKSFQGANLHFEAQDIHLFLRDCETIDIFLLINSIFLLPRPKELMVGIHRKLSEKGKLLIIIPNTESENFKKFQHLNPNQNTFIIGKDEAGEFFKNAGFDIGLVKGLGFITIFGNRMLPHLWKLKGAYIYAGNFINRLAGKKPSYWGFILTKA